jgi:hypothetical protein
MPRESSSATSDVNPPSLGLRIIRTMHPCAARAETAECVGWHWRAGQRGLRLLVAGALGRIEVARCASDR